MTETHPIHPLGKRARILLSSVFGPYGQDDDNGSRQINPMELYQNQVTRFQGVFSLRMFHRSFGLLMIQENIEAPCTLLDFPDLERFSAELVHNRYDIIGLSAIIPNVGKVKVMCDLIRRHQPWATIVIGGHVANLTDLAERVSADHIVKGDGVRWFRRYLGQDDQAPIRHPQVLSANGTRILGLTLRSRPGETAAIVIPSVGCPMGCNFCSTSALFGGKGKFINFYESGDELFAIISQLEAQLNTQSFFVLDENFLLHRQRALRLLALMREKGKSWSFYVFSSARVLKSYHIDELVALGISWVWMGLEGEKSEYRKLNGVDTRSLVGELQAHGIRVLGSTIIGLESHRPENMDQVIDYAVSHDTDFHQFMLYTANVGTPLHQQLQSEGRLRPESEFALADSHGQYRFNHRHPHIRDHQEEHYLATAFSRDFIRNGPSLYRLIRTMLRGWQRYRQHSDQRIRSRFQREVRPLATTYAAAVWAMRRWYQDDPPMAEKMTTLLHELYQAFGWRTRLTAPLLGRYLGRAMNTERRGLAAGLSLEPPTFYQDNPAAVALRGRDATVDRTGPAVAGRVAAQYGTGVVPSPRVTQHEGAW